MWGSRGEVPGDFRIPLWRLATDAGLPWTPPGCEGLALVRRPAGVAA